MLAALMLTAAVPGLFLSTYAAEADAAVTPVIALTYVPAYGENAPVTGAVFTEDGSAYDPADYRISLFVQPSEGAQCYPKPTYDHPYTDLGDDGTFNAVFNTDPAGNDLKAGIFHIMLIPSDHTPGEYPATREAALDYVKVVRTKSGNITITPEREAPPPPGAEPAINAHTAASWMLCLNMRRHR